MNDEQHQQRRKPGQHDPHPPDGERGQRRKLHGLPGGLEGQIAADLGRLHLLPDAVFVFQIDIQLAVLPIGRAEADGVRVRAVVRQAKLPLLDDGTRHMRGGRMAVRDVLAIFPDGLRDAGRDLTEGGGRDGLRLRLQAVGCSYTRPRPGRQACRRRAARRSGARRCWHGTARSQWYQTRMLFSVCTSHSPYCPSTAGMSGYALSGSDSP